MRLAVAGCTQQQIRDQPHSPGRGAKSVITHTDVVNYGVISLPPIKKNLHDSISLIEQTFYACAANDESKSFEVVTDWLFKHESTKTVFRNQARMVQFTAIKRNLPVVWLTETNTALETLTNFLCHHAKIDAKRIAQGYILEKEFPLLTMACDAVLKSKLRMCDVDSTEEFEEIALALAKDNEFSFLLCDWDLNREEILFAESLAQKGNVTVCWPK